MKSFKGIFIGLGLCAVLGILHAQFATQSLQEIQPVSEAPNSIVQLTAQANGLELVAPENLPRSGTFWLVTSNGLPPAPYPCLPGANPLLPVYSIAPGQFLVDGSAGQVALKKGPARLQTWQSRSVAVESALAVLAGSVVDLIGQIQESQLARETALVFGMELDSSESFTPLFAVADTNGLWLEITNQANGLAYLNLHNGTNQVYAIWGTTNLLSPWQVETELWPTNGVVIPTVTPFMLPTWKREMLFLRAQDWTGVDANTNGVPDWWEWRYWGSLSLNYSMTNLDYSNNGLTFAEDYSNNIPPTVFSYTGLSVTNSYVRSSAVPVTLDVAGAPYYVAVLVDDANFSNAVWNPYSGSTVTVNLGSVQGWHEVWIGLRGHAEDASDAVWQYKQIKLDWTPPDLFIINPTNTTVDIPMIQLQGFSPEALSSISYDLTNAAGLVTNQQILVLNQHYDTNTWEFTTNTWQAFDVVLTNGVNTFIFHATDLAGNTTTASIGLTLDYASKTNPPGVQVTWPTNGTEISGNRFTLDGQVDDATVTVATTITDINGNTSTVNGLVERTGKFWVENLPLNSGTNAITLVATDAVGHATTNSLSVAQSAVTLTMNSVSDPQQLWQPTVNLTGTISDASYAIWVNGVKGHNNGYGTWSASNVPVNDGGTASFTAIGYAPNEQQPDGSYGNP